MDINWPQASRFCTISHSTILPVLNCNTKRNSLQVEHVNYKLMVNLFLSLVFMKISVEKQHSFSIEPITCTTSSLANLVYSGILISRNWKEVKVLHNLVIGLTSKCFCITNLTFFVMVLTNKDLWRSKVGVENKPRTNTSLSPTFLS
jgi:hypothetical protein